MGVGRLQTLDLSDNSLQQVTQRSLAGLHANLEVFELDNNQITRLDRCVFYRFDSIDLLRVGYTPCFRKKTSTHIIGYKLRNCCLILTIFDTKIPHII